MIWIRLIGAIASLAYFAWTLATVFIVELRQRGFRPEVIPALVRWIRCELRPFALPLLFASYLPNFVTHMSWLDWIFFVLSAVFWLVFRTDKDDDDRWKRRRKKLADKVAEVGGKLTVVPAGSQA